MSEASIFRGRLFGVETQHQISLEVLTSPGAALASVGACDRQRHALQRNALKYSPCMQGVFSETFS